MSQAFHLFKIGDSSMQMMAFIKTKKFLYVFTGAVFLLSLFLASSFYTSHIKAQTSAMEDSYLYLRDQVFALENTLEEKSGILESLEEDIETKQGELEKTEENLAGKEAEQAGLEKEYSEKTAQLQEEYDETVAMIERRDEVQEELESLEERLEAETKVLKASLEKELAGLEKEVKTKQAEADKLAAEIEAKNEELENVTTVIREKKEEPVSLSAGMFVVGHDIEPGRYLVEPVGRGSNFVTYDANGKLSVNIILSNRPDHGVSEYVLFLGDQYIIDSNTPATFTPIE
ncbi:hypothetical protein MM300_06670 [Evansella sp. LMS18]|jgi:myosin heavy subunit|uniref:hypothetical protein n=1 Tax=Evansella sp. LMS18 TaxID=2924033 RepID=UPI0020D00D13|nr:hypothetical protein [Evansella sp. LMS18]UTR11972.1 hypothetical protein MM300_06670 [Evansella sp. LMS18]